MVDKMSNNNNNSNDSIYSMINLEELLDGTPPGNNGATDSNVDSHDDDSRPTKRGRFANNNNNNSNISSNPHQLDEGDIADRTEMAWEHYRNYLDSVDEGLYDDEDDEDGEDGAENEEDDDNDDDQVVAPGIVSDEDEEENMRKNSDKRPDQCKVVVMGDVRVIDKASKMDGGGEGELGDVDELLELISVLSPFIIAPYKEGEEEDDGGGNTTNGNDKRIPKFDTVQPLVPILMSMALLHLANHAIGYTMLHENDSIHEHYNNNNNNNNSDNNNNNSSSTTTPTTSTSSTPSPPEAPLIHNPHKLIQKSLYYWSTNPHAISSMAKYHQMNFTLDTKSICKMYMHAAECAGWWRKVGFSILMNGEKEDDENEEEEKERIRVEEWVELLIVNGALGVDYIGEDDDDDDDEEDIGEDDNEMDSKEKQQVNNGNNNNKKDKDNNMEEHNAKSRNNDSNKYQYSYSEIEANASFMSSLLLSTLGKHDEALQYLEQFQLSHRIHPNVWKEAQSQSQGNNDNNRKEDKSNVSNSDASVAVPFLPRVYRQCKDNATATENNGQGILPPYLYQRLCNLFAPNAPYWNESGYNHRGYYSYFIDLEAKNKRNSTATATAAAAAAAAPSSGVGVKECPTNCIEDVIINHLLPLAERTLKDENDKEDTKNNKHIVGAEWWVHTRPLGANLGHQLHFDTDESLLGKEKKVTHPIVSSILYLTGANPASSSSSTAGSTIVFDQTPNSKEVASQVWIGHAQDNACMHFPGNLLHGVLPCAGGGGEGKGSTTNASENNRLTFMVGFWTRNVPEGMGDDRQLYGPCGPLPPATPEHSWVIDCQRGYTVNNTGSRASHAIQDRGEQQKGIIQEILPCASPAWEKINTKKKHESNSNTCNKVPLSSAPPLIIPKELDHRYFVSNAPHCFSESMFDKGGCF